MKYINDINIGYYILFAIIRFICWWICKLDEQTPSWRKESLFKNKTFIIIKATDKSVTLQTGEEKPFTRKPSMNLYNRQWMVKIGDGYRGTWYKGGETAWVNREKN